MGTLWRYALLFSIAAFLGLAQAADRAAPVNCATSGQVPNCDVTGEGTLAIEKNEHD